MKLHAAIALSLASMTSHFRPFPSSGYSYPLTNNRRTGKAAERRKAKQRRRARA
ncbi:hypothetical protein [Buttiauxella noackiae]|uniref:hypothetical protein n=1 Tax=Buttiauxella noackiae TaxID=82992 RepID=UPI0028D39AC5|nr:hypothetical protein [Buttiauxella noackiae]